jgi:hypothetical protein
MLAYTQLVAFTMSNPAAPTAPSEDKHHLGVIESMATGSYWGALGGWIQRILTVLRPAESS